MTIFQIPSSHVDWLKNMAARGWGCFSLYGYSENLKYLLAWQITLHNSGERSSPLVFFFYKYIKNTIFNCLKMLFLVCSQICEMFWSERDNQNGWLYWGTDSPRRHFEMNNWAYHDVWNISSLPLSAIYEWGITHINSLTWWNSYTTSLVKR